MSIFHISGVAIFCPPTDQGHVANLEPIDVEAVAGGEDAASPQTAPASLNPQRRSAVQ